MSQVDSRWLLGIPVDTPVTVRPTGMGPEYSVVAHWNGPRADTVPIARTRSLNHAEVVASALASLIGAERGTLLR